MIGRGSSSRFCAVVTISPIATSREELQMPANSIFLLNGVCKDNPNLQDKSFQVMKPTRIRIKIDADAFTNEIPKESTTDPVFCTKQRLSF